MIKVINEVEVFTNKDSHDPIKESLLMVVNHPSDDTMIIIIVDGKEYKIVAKDLQMAILNSVNCARH